MQNDLNYVSESMADDVREKDSIKLEDISDNELSDNDQIWVPRGLLYHYKSAYDNNGACT